MVNKRYLLLMSSVSSLLPTVYDNLRKAAHSKGRLHQCYLNRHLAKLKWYLNCHWT